MNNRDLHFHLPSSSTRRVSPSNSLNRRASTTTTTTTTTSSSGDYVSATEDATEGPRRTQTSACVELQRQRNKEQFDRLFGKVRSDSNLRPKQQHSPLKGGGVSLATILQDNGSRRSLQGGEGELLPETGGMLSNPVQSTLVSEFPPVWGVWTGTGTGTFNSVREGGGW